MVCSCTSMNIVFEIKCYFTVQESNFRRPCGTQLVVVLKILERNEEGKF